MKLLFDHNLSPKLVAKLVNLYPASSHVALLGLDTSSDLVVWQHAQQAGYCLVAKDSDLNDLVAAKGFPPKVIWIRLGNCTTSAIVTLLQTHYEAILEFEQEANAGLLELQNDIG
jgi:predicted nuclease of predicted toxin-antitoxin system